MAKPTKARADGKADVLRSLADALAPYLRDALSQEPEPTEYFDQNDSPLGRRRHLELVRKGVLQGRKVGKRVLVSRRAMRQFLEQHPVVAQRETAASDRLEDWGLARRRR